MFMMTLWDDFHTVLSCECDLVYGDVGCGCQTCHVLIVISMCGLQPRKAKDTVSS